MLISAAIVSIGMTRILGWPLGASLIFGILIAATDLVSVIALLKDLGIAGRLRLLVESESLFNDGVAAVLFGLALPYAQNHSGMDLSSWYLLVSVSGGGVATGIVVAVAALLVAGRTRDHLVETAVTTVAAYGAFLLADDLHVSGVLATVSAGLVFGTIGLRAGGRRLGLSRQGQAFVLDLWEFLAFIANSVVFLLIGVSISRMHFQDVGYGALALLILLVQVGRAATVYPLGTLLRSSRRAIPMREQHVLSWGGLRGALALALALSLPDTFPIRDAVVVGTFGVVAFSVIVQGLTLPALIRALKLMPMSDNKKQNF